MFGQLYDRALGGEHCWVRRDDGRVERLPVRSWLGGPGADAAFDDAVLDLCQGPTLDLGCGPGRLVATLVRRGLPALGVDLSTTAVKLARDSGAPVLRRDVFGRLPATGRWHTVLLADGNVGLGADPHRILSRAAELLCRGGRCLAEFDSATTGIDIGWIRLESVRAVGPWFRWASVGVDCVGSLAAEAGFAVAGIHRIGPRVVAQLIA
ncbi:class I SAM-dependent methyltransferase [Mycobacterium sp. 4D054]|uniref:class I SAM-dependent methyltransferase n=1 Tax=unclassified Mycobacterium TaxID=2642494 RepID=UPI0021B16294|nr:class I SAM-dependent methyltransferase [Mycobacterium sp. SMC-8]UXA14353.1 class I SAM-dependent methyltransferase [Mycobacterium sp. SMC-8]